MVGASANIVAVGAARQAGVRISFLDFARISVPITLVSLALSSLYLTAAVWLAR
jgi:Na+/H+ antiporter NhaD/arsenite permease-like protein